MNDQLIFAVIMFSLTPIWIIVGMAVLDVFQRWKRVRRVTSEVRRIIAELPSKIQSCEKDYPEREAILNRAFGEEWTRNYWECYDQIKTINARYWAAASEVSSRMKRLRELRRHHLLNDRDLIKRIDEALRRAHEFTEPNT